MEGSPPEGCMGCSAAYIPAREGSNRSHVVFVGGSDGNDLLRDGEDFYGRVRVLTITGPTPSDPSTAAADGAAAAAAASAADGVLLRWHREVLPRGMLNPRLGGRCHAMVNFGGAFCCGHPSSSVDSVIRRKRHVLLQRWRSAAQLLSYAVRCPSNTHTTRISHTHTLPPPPLPLPPLLLTRLVWLWWHGTAWRRMALHGMALHGAAGRLVCFGGGANISNGVSWLDCIPTDGTDIEPVDEMLDSGSKEEDADFNCGLDLVWGEPQGLADGSSQPRPRLSHAAVRAGRHILVFGGWSRASTQAIVLS
eukprot:COSAG06_NODE_11181_length_1549_cov_1.387319_2_plen_307_part_00